MFDTLITTLPTYLDNGFWRFLASLLILLLGLYSAGQITKWARQATSQLFHQKQVQESPLGVLFEPAASFRGSGLFSTVLYSIVMFMFIAWAGEILGITFFSTVMTMFVHYLPSVLSAFIVLIMGILLAGIAERAVKQQFRKLASSQAVLAGTITSSFVMVMFVLIALSELGIASAFIMILFGGFVLAFALALGIAFGFGAKEMVANALHQMVKDETEMRTKRQRTEKSSLD